MKNNREGLPFYIQIASKFSEEGTGSNNSIDDWKDRTHSEIRSAEDFSKGRTWFSASDGDGYRWKRLKGLDDGKGEADRKADKDEQGYRRDLHAWSSQLQLTNAQLDRAEYLFGLVDMAKAGTISSEALILAAISLAANEDQRMIKQEDIFHTIRDSAGVGRKTLRTARQRIRDQTNSNIKGKSTQTSVDEESPIPNNEKEDNYSTPDWVNEFIVQHEINKLQIEIAIGEIEDGEFSDLADN